MLRLSCEIDGGLACLSVTPSSDDAISLHHLLPSFLSLSLLRLFFFLLPQPNSDPDHFGDESPLILERRPSSNNSSLNKEYKSYMHMVTRIFKATNFGCASFYSD